MSLEKIQKEFVRYGFREFERWNEELELSAIDLEKWSFLKSFCRLSTGYLTKFASYVNPLFIPSGWYASVVMNGVKDKAVIEDAKQFYRELMVLHHQGLKAELASEKEQVKYLKDFLKKYSSLKKKTITFLDVCEEIFVRDTSGNKEHRGYLG